MAILEEIWVVHTTSFEQDSETDEDFSLEIQSQGQRAVFNFPDQPHNEREQGRTDEYRFDLRDFQFDDEAMQPGEIRMSIRGPNAWRPSSVWAIGRNVEGGFRLLAANPDWPSTATFSTEAGDVGAQISRPLDQP